MDNYDRLMGGSLSQPVDLTLKLPRPRKIKNPGDLAKTWVLHAANKSNTFAAIHRMDISLEANSMDMRFETMKAYFEFWRRLPKDQRSVLLG